MTLGPEMDEALDKMAARITDEAKEQVRRGGGRLTSPQVESALRRSFTARGPFADIVEETVARWRAEEAAMSRWAKARRWVRWTWIEGRRRIAFAWDHLMGRECECND